MKNMYQNTISALLHGALHVIDSERFIDISTTLSNTPAPRYFKQAGTRVKERAGF
jgi:hypothetical protein